MKQLTFLIAIFFALCSCTPQATEEKEEMDETSKQNVELINKLIASYEAEDIEAFKEVFDTSVSNVGPGMKDEVNYDQLVKGMEVMFEKWDSIKLDVISILPQHSDKEGIEGDWVMLWTGVSMYNLEHGKTIEFPYHSVARIENGKIVFEADYFDTWTINKQLGYEMELDDDDDDDDDAEDDD